MKSREKEKKEKWKKTRERRKWIKINENKRKEKYGLIRVNFARREMGMLAIVNWFFFFAWKKWKLGDEKELMIIKYVGVCVFCFVFLGGGFLIFILQGQRKERIITETTTIKEVEKKSKDRQRGKKAKEKMEKAT